MLNRICHFALKNYIVQLKVVTACRWVSLSQQGSASMRVCVCVGGSSGERKFNKQPVQ